MKAAVWHGVGDVRFDEVADPQIKDPTDAIIEITTSAVCGTVRSLRPGDRVVVPATETFDRREPGWTKVALGVTTA